MLATGVGQRLPVSLVVVPAGTDEPGGPCGSSVPPPVQASGQPIVPRSRAPDSTVLYAAPRYRIGTRPAHCKERTSEFARKELGESSVLSWSSGPDTLRSMRFSFRGDRLWDHGDEKRCTGWSARDDLADLHNPFERTKKSRVKA
ncbi:hypothetical protein AXG93_903s1070 [Marchantia polymorpha subsp. ruderalis]|uniref:Uncharacterized protein n=1 Tax=Marchantia polymorpha subsp. ruderalis TaxID=1480154 RepID=A0A176W1R2_MARPO|nr:hypothetical protein AXG93_903s1070 [Marchantia polymorpha subsp. ruderalis]